MLSEIAQKLSDKYLLILYERLYDFGETFIRHDQPDLVTNAFNKTRKETFKEAEARTKAKANRNESSINNPTLPTEADQLRAELVRILSSDI